MRHFIFIFILYMIFSMNYALSDSRGAISGVVKDKQTGSTLEGAAIQLINPADNSVIKGTETDNTGKYRLENIPQGIYNVRIKYVGYSEVVIKNVNINPNGLNIVLEEVNLTSASTVTEEILVESEKSDVQLAPDRKIFNLEKNNNLKGGTAIDVLRNLPSINIDADNNISLRGSEGVKILIDGKPSGLDGSNRSLILQQLSADQISSVEIITNPSAKYDAEGTSGIINIILKKKEGLGYNGNFSLNAGTRDKYSGATSFNFKKDNINFFVNYDYNLNNFVIDGYGDRKYFTGTISDINNLINATMRMNSHLVKGGFDVSLGTLSASISANYLQRDRTRNESMLTNEYMQSGEPLSIFNTFTNDKGVGKNFDINLFLTQKFKDPKQTITGDFAFSDSRDNSVVRTFSGAELPLDIKQNNNDIIRNARGQIDYVHPFSESTKLETGIKYLFRQNDKDFTQEDYNNNYPNNYDPFSNNFVYNEHISSGYGTFSGKISEINFVTGLRTENTYTKGDLTTTGETFSKKYTDFFPSLSLSYKLASGSDIQASYSRRINRPMVQWLNPFRIMFDPKNQWAGNPDLMPEYTDSYELSFVQYIGKTSITPTVYYRNVNDKISRTLEFIDSVTTLMTFVNYNSTKTYGTEVMVNSQVLPWWNVNGSFSLYRQKDDASNLSYNDPTTEYRTTWTARASSSLKFPEIVNLQLNYFYSGKYYFVNGYLEPFQSMDVSVNRDIIPNRLNIGARVSDVFNTMKFKVNIDEKNYTQEFQRKRDTRVFYMTLSYKFGQSDQQPQRRPRNRENNEPQDGFGF